MKFLLFLLLQHAVYLGTNMQYLKGSTYYTSCMSSDDCFGSEECLDDPICNQSKCQCDSAHFYNKISNTCEGKKKYEAEECDNCDQCSTWFSVCETVASRGKSVCTCPSGYFYESDTDSCTNIERCPEDSSYIFFRDENVCYKVETDCVGCQGWDHFCKENSSVPLKFVGNLQQHLIDRLWSYGISAYQDLSDEVKTIILSTVHNNTADGEKLVWYWPSGGVVPIDDGIDYTDWTNAIEAEGCLHMLSDACQPVFRAERPCRLQNAYRGCFIQLPAAYCNTHIDERGTVWEFTKGGTVVTKSCPAGYTGEVTRGCATNGEFKLPFYNCTLEIFKNLTEKLENGNVSAPEALADVSSSIKDLDDLFIGDLLEVQNILHKIVNLVDETVNSTISENSTNDFIETASFLIDSEKNGREWESRVENEGKGAEEFLNVVETFVKLAADSLLGSNKSSLSLAKKNIVFEYAEIDTKNTAPEAISFPTANRHSPDWNNTLTSSLQLDTSSFKNEGVKAFTSLLYRNLSKSVPQTLEGKSRDVKVDINSQVISFVLLPKSPDILNPELGLQFHGFKDMGSSEQHCSFWKTDLSRGKSFWSTKGCRKVAGNSTVVTCKCNHLTNFALLVSTYVPPEKDVRILGILTYIGCSVSMFFICITLGAHVKYWRLMKSDKAILLVCLCVTFLVCYALFLAGVTKTSNESVCTGIAVVLHYVFLVLFFLMLAEGVSVFITVTFPFHKKSHITELLIIAFRLPPEAYSIWEAYPWRFGKAFCIIKALFAEMTSYASVLTITAFTIERYIAICKPLKSHKIVAFSRCIKIIIAIWVISLCCALPYPIHTDLFYYVKDEAGNPIQDSLQCNIPSKYYERMTHVFQLSTFVFFVFPLTVIIVLYSLIGCTLRKAELSREPSDKRYHGSCRHNNPGQHERSPTFIARRSVLKVLVAVVVAFFVCWAPFHAQRLLTVFNRHWTPLLFDLQSSLFYISGVLYFVGSTVNPILYNVMSRRYRLAFLETICRNRTSRSYSSQRHTNGGTSFRRKQSSLKGSFKWPHYGNNRHGDTLQLENSVCRYKRCYERCGYYGNTGNIALADGSNNLCAQSNSCVKQDGSARIRAYKGKLSPQGIMHADNSHAAKCARHNHVDYINLQCTNLVDIPPLCLNDDVSGHYEKTDLCSDYDIVGNKPISGANGNKNYLVKLDTDSKDVDDNCKNILLDRGRLTADEIGVFV